MLATLKILLLGFSLLYLLPIGLSAALYAARGGGAGWQIADRSSTGLLPAAATHHPAVVRVLAAQTVRWRGIFAVHCWIVFKEEGAARYTRYDYTAWGEPIRMNGFEPDGRWFGHAPDVVFAADGAEAAALIPRLRQSIAAYAYRNQGDYRAWPGPNSNTFVAAVLDGLGLPIALPPTAIGKDFPHDGRWLRATPSGTGWQISLGGYAGLTLGWVEGVELNILGAVAGMDLRRPAVKLPGLGRIGVGG
ncbi:DUF3750 domain-containing protein [Roseomonas sp. GC11]|uniref:DUF3750 domain-containing protein n=1 Tax=Roseomonas sp. GC11 TaxID=2950546 RepID=UPI00210E7594|nr:DUF3750 domain-containing protein [Roseomonas sp. GC11]MCQ4160801.1 DUF3750 domain-containing protein [Roseomonas sp. GC11]